jgi:hypothetical protein
VLRLCTGALLPGVAASISKQLELVDMKMSGMSSQPSLVFDGLVKEIVETPYRLIGLTIGTLIIPFVKRTKRFWPAMVASESRLSSLSVFIIWTFGAFSLITGTLSSVPEVLLIKRTNYPILYILIVTFIVVIIADLALRLCCSFIHNTVRRRFYTPILRLSLAAISFGAFADLLTEVFLGRFPAAELFFSKTNWFPTAFQAVPVNGLEVVYLIPLAFFGLPLAVVTNKIIGGKSIARKLLTFLCIALFIPVALTNLAYQVYFKSNEAISSILPSPKIGIIQMNTVCDVTGDRLVTVRSYLMLVNTSSYVLAGSNFIAIGDVYEGKRYVLKRIAQGRFDQTIILTNSTFMRVQLAMDLDQDVSKPTEPLTCRLALSDPLEEKRPMSVRE